MKPGVFVSAVVVGAALLLLSGCGGNRYCLKEQAYQKAQTLPPLSPVPGLQLPDSTAALRIPEQPAVVIPFGVADARGQGVCLDKPPRLQAAPTPAA